MGRTVALSCPGMSEMKVGTAIDVNQSTWKVKKKATQQGAT
jgi:hypothetical protein